MYKYQCAVSSKDDEDKGEETFGGNGHFGRNPSNILHVDVGTN